MVAALDDDVRQDLEQALRIHGWPCSAVEDYRPLAEDRFQARCADGHRYRIMLRPGWDLGPKERRTGLRSLVEVARLVENLEARDAEGRRSAALGLGDLGPTGTAAAPHLIRTLQDEDPMVRRSAAEALGRIGSGASQILAALVKAIDDPDPEVGAAAVVALGEIGPAARDAAPALEAALHGYDPTVRDLAAAALAKINAPPPSETGASAR
jgi:HEAT repeat protein